MRRIWVFLAVMACRTAHEPTAGSSSPPPPPPAATDATAGDAPAPIDAGAPADAVAPVDAAQPRTMRRCKPGTCFYPGEGCIKPVDNPHQHGGKCTRCTPDGNCMSSR